MTERRYAKDGYQPQVRPDDHKRGGYQPTSPNSRPDGTPDAGYQPRGSDGPKPSPSPKPPGSE